PPEVDSRALVGIRRDVSFRDLPYGALGDLPPRAEAEPFFAFREIADGYRMESEQNPERPFIHPGWQCGPLIIEYTGRKNERFRAEFNFVGRWDGGPPQP